VNQAAVANVIQRAAAAKSKRDPQPSQVSSRGLVAASAIAGMRNIDVLNARPQKSATATLLKLFLLTQYLHLAKRFGLKVLPGLAKRAFTMFPSAF
jgi:hypothetical protein